VDRYGATSGDSPLGNLVAEAAREAALSDLSLVGASSLRHDLPPGLHDEETLTRVLPFEDPVVAARISGRALIAALDRAARSASSRDCRTQVHVAGARLRFRCPCATDACARAWVHGTSRA
jgi:5'-nucleotidase